MHTELPDSSSRFSYMMSDDELPPAIDRAMAWDPFESPARSKAAAKADTPKQKPAAATPESSASAKRKHTSTQGTLNRVNYPGGFVDALTDGCVTAGCGKFRRKFAVGQFADRAAMLSAAEAWIIDKSGTTGDKSDATGNDLLNGAGGDEATAAGAVDAVMKRPSAAGGDETTAAGTVDDVMKRPSAAGGDVMKRPSAATMPKQPSSPGQGTATRKSPLTDAQTNDMNESARELVEEASVSCPIEPHTKTLKWKEFSKARHAALREAHAGHNMLVYSKAVALEWASVKRNA